MELRLVLSTPVAAIGRWVLSAITDLGHMAIFFVESLFLIFTPPYSVARVVDQIHFIGRKSMFVILLTGSFTGMVLGLQGYYALVRLGSEGVLGSVVALTLIREMGPVLTAFMVIGRAGFGHGRGNRHHEDFGTD